MKYFLLFCSIAAFLHSSGQDKNVFYAMDSNMNQTVLDSSKYILWIHEKEDSNWQWDYYYTWGPLIKSQSFADHDGKMLNGRSCFYNKGGNIDSTGVFDHGKKNGIFSRFKTFTNDSIVVKNQYKYVNDSLVASPDSSSFASFDKQKTECQYAGGDSSWKSYLQNNLSYPSRALEKNIQGQVSIAFFVDEEGNVNNTFIEKSIEYSLDQAALALIRKSGKWIPARVNGIRVQTYKVQPVNFKLLTH